MRGSARFAHVPLEIGPRRFGVLSVAHPDEGALGAESLALLESLARPAAAAIANALEFQHERRIASALTRGFIPDAPPELEGFSLGLVYEPVGQEVSGGDVFGVWRQPDAALAVLVGDVSGKGIEVAAVSAMVRFFIEAGTWDADCPAQVLAQANAILRRRLPGAVAMVTAWLGVIDGGVLRYANAGHVPPLVVEEGDGAAAESCASCRRPDCRSASATTSSTRRASCPSAAAPCSSPAPTGSSNHGVAASSSARRGCRRLSPPTRGSGRRRSSSSPTPRPSRSPTR
ncbi:MAG TPA: PP2C family protein-serine/threonine phosphatase [Solirubrobacteraceae bacterium]|nr:PP2C family protein-serine/threonine phosphatase [Solirubrobacteraceae bacterium]